MSGRARRTILLCSALVAGLLALDGWAALRLGGARDSAAEAAEAADQGARLVDRIELLRRKPVLAAAAAADVDAAVAGQLERAAREAGMPAAALVSVSPQPSVRVGDGPYLEKPTAVLLRDVTLRQIIGFLCSASAPQGGGLRVKALRLSAPRGQEPAAGGDRWAAEATLTSLIYAPRPQSPAAASVSRAEP